MIHAAIQNTLVPVVGVLATKAGLDLGFFIGLLGCSACVIVQLFFPVRTISFYPRPSHPTNNTLRLRMRGLPDLLPLSWHGSDRSLSLTASRGSWQCVWVTNCSVLP
eukprot:COSAG02_NODE_1809_length_10835_cov_7.682843_9_plen_107_part_00